MEKEREGVWWNGVYLGEGPSAEKLAYKRFLEGMLEEKKHKEILEQQQFEKDYAPALIAIITISSCISYYLITVIIGML